MSADTYVLITAVRNEEKYIANTIKSVVGQTIRPITWIIVSDGSTDATDDIVERYVEMYPFIDFVRRKGDARRNFGSQVHAINAGYEKVRGLAYDYIGNLDSDITFHPDYFAVLLHRLSENPLLGLAGGWIYEEQKGDFKPRRNNSTSSVPHAVQLFRKSCFEEIGGYIPLRYGGPDWHAEVMARLRKWHVESFTDLPVYHHKPSLTSEGKLKGGVRQGRMDYSLGSSPFFEVAKCLARVRLKPYGLYSMSRLAGFFWGYFVHEKRPVSMEFMTFLRKEQTLKLIRCIKYPVNRIRQFSLAETPK